MIGTNSGGLSIAGSPTPAAPAVAMQLDSLRGLLLRAAEALCAGDASQIQQACEDLTSAVVNLRPAFGELFPNRNGMALAESEQQRRRLLLPVLEARAFYLAALRRCRRGLFLRRNLMEMRRDAPTYGGTEISRWC